MRLKSIAQNIILYSGDLRVMIDSRIIRVIVGTRCKILKGFNVVVLLIGAN